MTTSLDSSTWTELPDRPIVLVPLGSTEQHGPHLPFTTDALIAEAVARAAAQRLSEATGRGVVVAPTLTYGASGEHQGFPGTISIGHEALRHVLVEMIRSISTWANSIVLVNGHGGNTPTVKEVVHQLRHEQHDVTSIACSLESPTDAHAGHDETSLMLYLNPNLVRMNTAAPGNTQPLDEILQDLMAVGVRPVSPSGVLGDPSTADARTGQELFQALVDHVVAHSRTT